MTTHTLTPSRRGFSLFEVLMFLAVLGTLLGLLIPMLTPSSDYVATRNRRNAQEVAMVFSAAQIAGLHLEGATVEETVRNVIEGGAPLDGVFKNHHFGVRSLGEADIAGAAEFLKLEGGQLLYNGTQKNPSVANNNPSPNNSVEAPRPPANSSPVVVWDSGAPSSSPATQPAGARIQARF